MTGEGTIKGHTAGHSLLNPLSAPGRYPPAILHNTTVVCASGSVLTNENSTGLRLDGAT